MTTSKDNDRCCLPYNDGLMVSAQILSFFALALSWTTLWSLIIGAITWLLLMIVWCCKMRRCGLITTGILALTSAASCIVAAIMVLVYGSTSICNYIDENATDDTLTSQPDFHTDCKYSVNVYVGLAFGAGALWLITAVLIFMFSCGGRLDKYELPR